MVLVICINVQDHYAPLINDVADIEAHMTAIRDWLRDYKLTKVNEYGYDGKCMNREFAEAVVGETHEFWKQHICSGFTIYLCRCSLFVSYRNWFLRRLY